MLKECDAFFVASVTSIERAFAASVESQQDYSYDDIRFGERFVDIYEERPDGKLAVDYGRIHDTEPIPVVEELNRDR
jgi:hypothetical protein